MEAQWCGDDRLEILQRKRELLRMSLVAHDIADELSDAAPTCGMGVLIKTPTTKSRTTGRRCLPGCTPADSEGGSWPIACGSLGLLG